MKKVFTRIVNCSVPATVSIDPTSGRNKPFEITFSADGLIPFPQVILRSDYGEQLFRGDQIRSSPGNEYAALIPADLLGPGHVRVQVEGCRVAEISKAGGGDWVKCFGETRIEQPPRREAHIAAVSAKAGQAGNVKLYFSIHKHMHQPYYQAADRSHWDGEKDGIFGSRSGPYSRFIPAAVWQYIKGGLPHAGLSTSWSGSLIEQLDRCEREGLCGGAFRGWKTGLIELAREKTALGNKRVGFSAFGFFHPLMALIPGRDIVTQIDWHRRLIKDTFGTDPISTLFPPETAFHVRMIPALLRAGVKAVIYDSIHRFRTCKDYPYAGLSEGMLPPSPADQENPAVNDWMQLHNIWAGSKISPSLLKPEYVKYEDVDGKVYKILAIPAERYIGNEDARGGYGALQYGPVLGQVYDNIVSHHSFDPKHPPFFILHSDGDNHGGGADSYYNHNTGRLVEWIKEDPRFELTTIDDYLQRFPPDPAKAVHLEPGSWSGADNGDPQFRKWFSRYEDPYSPDLNSWAVLTALQNVIYSLEDRQKKVAELKVAGLEAAQRLLLTAETSCYWYWTGQDVWDCQVTQASNAALALIKGDMDRVVSSGKDSTGPTIFAPWVTPENPGGKAWGQGCLRDADKIGTVHTFVFDASGLRRVELVLRQGGKETRQAMKSHGAYPSRTGASLTSEYFTCQLPQGAGDVRYYIEAEDRHGNRCQSCLERAFLA
jgi:hypothetical protein